MTELEKLMERLERAFMIFGVMVVAWAVLVVMMTGLLAIIVMAMPAKAEPYVSMGASGIESLNQSNSDPTEFSSDPWFGLQVEVGDDAWVRQGPVGVGVGVEGSLIPAMPQHGQNDTNKAHGDADSRHRTADGQTITMGSAMVVVEPQVHLWDGTRAYIVGGAGVGAADGVGAAYQGGIGVKQEITDNLTADASFRYRRINELAFVGPELRLTWAFDTPFGRKLEGVK